MANECTDELDEGQCFRDARYVNSSSRRLLEWTKFAREYAFLTIYVHTHKSNCYDLSQYIEKLQTKTR